MQDRTGAHDFDKERCGQRAAGIQVHRGDSGTWIVGSIARVTCFSCLERRCRDERRERQKGSERSVTLVMQAGLPEHVHAQLTAKRTCPFKGKEKRKDLRHKDRNSELREQ